MHRPDKPIHATIILSAAALTLATSMASASAPRPRDNPDRPIVAETSIGRLILLDSEHTDWPDYPSLPPTGGEGEAARPISDNPPDRLERLKRRIVWQLDEHTDWPDYPEGDPDSIFNTPFPAPEPTDPTVIIPINGAPNLDGIMNPAAPQLGTGIGLDAPLPTPAPVPAPGSLIIALGLSAAAARRRRR